MERILVWQLPTQPSELTYADKGFVVNALRYIFSQMFSPTIMLLIGGFTIAAVLSKTRLDVMTATRILNAAGTKPSVVLLVLMCVATFASMWISNVAAPTLCYALIKVRVRPSIYVRGTDSAAHHRSASPQIGLLEVSCCQCSPFTEEVQ